MRESERRTAVMSASFLSFFSIVRRAPAFFVSYILVPAACDTRAHRTPGECQYERVSLANPKQSTKQAKNLNEKIQLPTNVTS